MFTQRYWHHLEAWPRLDVKEQEKVVGRIKPDSIELPGDGLHDHLMNNTTPVSGAMFFTPSLQTPERLAR